jgi:hypothetical protein
VRHSTSSPGKFEAGITVNKKMHYLGIFADVESAAKARADAERRMLGDFRWKG